PNKATRDWKNSRPSSVSVRADPNAIGTLPRDPGRLSAIMSPSGHQNRKLARLLFERRDRFVQPLDDHLCDRVAVLFHHHHVAVALDAAVGELDELDRHARLAQIFDIAVIVAGIE